jgi:hypothetical protein
VYVCVLFVNSSSRHRHFFWETAWRPEASENMSRLTHTHTPSCKRISLFDFFLNRKAIEIFSLYLSLPDLFSVLLALKFL